MNPQDEVTIKLPIATLNACLAALSKMPYEVAVDHIGLIQSRASAAMNEPKSELDKAE